jgi:hypothetical protein
LARTAVDIDGKAGRFAATVNVGVRTWVEANIVEATTSRPSSRGTHHDIGNGVPDHATTAPVAVHSSGHWLLPMTA